MLIEEGFANPASFQLWLYHNLLLELIMEGFVKVPGYEKYLIHPDGRVYSTKVRRILKHRVGSTGYPFVSFTENKVTKHFSIHRLLAFVFKDLPSLDSDLEVDHDNGNILDFSLPNLIVRTREEHMIKTHKDIGVRTGGSKCTVCGNSCAFLAKLCSKCVPIKNPDITAEQIEYWVTNYSWVKASKELGLSDNGLRKRYKSLTGKDPKSIKKKVSQVG